ncbi:MAG: efflux RND transporter periplasmic adaptor subunit [Gammaproteobacteria bacterium]|jgi:membrane fusion protein, multidrug efflux system|nr:efflux RND transporter periplasmic adaptor subunit [Gammaproteobacteria bacterium]
MNKSVGIAVTTCVALVLWMASGLVLRNDAEGLEGSDEALDSSQILDNRVLVEVTDMQAQEVTSYIITNGSAIPDREVLLRAETTGQIDQILVEEGAFVDEGSVIMQIKMDDRAIRQEQANINLQEKQRLYEAQANLHERGFVSSTELDNALTQFKLTEVDLERIKLEIEKTFIRAPFSGYIEENIVDLGEYVGIGNELTRIVDNDPLVVNAYVSQNDVEFLGLGIEAKVEMVNGRQTTGQVRFISPRADENTRTFRVEIAVPNTEGLRAGSSVVARIPRQQVKAHYLSAGLLTLNEDGEIGVKTVSLEGLVEFYPATIEMSDANGMWISGLPEFASIITVGQGFAAIGEAVRITVADSVTEWDADVPKPLYSELK